MSKRATMMTAYKANLSRLKLAEWGYLDDIPRGEQIEALLPLVISLAKDLNVPDDMIEDMVQVGNIAMIEALDKWQPGGMSRVNWVAVDVKRNIIREMTKQRLWQGHESLDWPPIRDHLPDDDDEAGTVPEPLIADEETQERMVDQQLAVEQLSSLSLRERTILRGTLFRNQTFQELGKLEGISKQRVEQVYREGLHKMYRSFEKLHRLSEKT